jgi:hypothetical protein
MEPDKFELVRSVGEECVTEAELRNLLEKKPNFILYDGFEPSGRMHIAQGVFKAFNVNKCTLVSQFLASHSYKTRLVESSSSGLLIGLPS